MDNILSGHYHRQHTNRIWLRVPFGNSEEGQALVEALLVLPLLITLIHGIFWLGEMGRTKIVMTIASREGARCESLGIPGEAVARAICLDNLPILSEDLRIFVDRGLMTVTVYTEYQFSPPFPSLSTELFPISAKTVMPLSL